MAKLGFHNSEILEPINIKFGVGDYVGDIIPHSKIQNNRPVGVSRHMDEISLSRGFYF